MQAMDQKAPPIQLDPPLAEKRPARDVHHGVERTDDYAWLRVPNWQEVMRDPSALSADVRAYLEAENAYTKTAMADTGALQETLFKEMKGRIKEDDFDRAVARRRLRLLHKLRHRRAASAPVPGTAGGRQMRGAARRRRAGRGQALLFAWRSRLEPRSQASRLRVRRQGIGVLQHPHPGPRSRRRQAG